MSNPPTLRDLIARRDDWRATLDRDYADTSARLQDAYRATLPPLRANIDALGQRVRHMEDLSPLEWQRLEEWRDLRDRITVEMDGFARTTGRLAGQIADRATAHGVQAALDMATAQAPGVSGVWLRPDPEMLARRDMGDVLARIEEAMSSLYAAKGDIREEVCRKHGCWKEER